MSNDLIKAIMDTPMEDGILSLLAKKDKQLSRYHDLQSPFRQGFMLAEGIVKEWAEKNFPLKKRKNKNNKSKT